MDKRKLTKSVSTIGDSTDSEEQDTVGDLEENDDNSSDIFTERESYNKLAKDLITDKKSWKDFM